MASGSHLLDWDAPRLLQLIDYLEREANEFGQVQVGRGEMVRALGYPWRSVGVHVGWAKTYGIIDVQRSFGDSFAQGSSANRYTLLMSKAEWLERGAEIREAERQRRIDQRRKAKAAKEAPRKMREASLPQGDGALGVPPEMAEQAQAAADAAVAAAEPLAAEDLEPPGGWPEPLSDEELGAWADDG